MLRAAWPACLWTLCILAHAASREDVAVDLDLLPFDGTTGGIIDRRSLEDRGILQANLSMASVLEGTASAGCQTCCGEAHQCQTAYKDMQLGQCCGTNPMMCCPSYARCDLNGCRRLPSAQPTYMHRHGGLLRALITLFAFIGMCCLLSRLCRSLGCPFLAVPLPMFGGGMLLGGFPVGGAYGRCGGDSCGHPGGYGGNVGGYGPGGCGPGGHAPGAMAAGGYGGNVGGYGPGSYGPGGHAPGAMAAGGYGRNVGGYGPGGYGPGGHAPGAMAAAGGAGLLGGLGLGMLMNDGGGGGGAFMPADGGFGGGGGMMAGDGSMI